MHPMLAGAAAGLAVDIVLYPLDTVKTRLQSGTRVRSKLFAGYLLTLASAPSAALFFTVYEAIRPYNTVIAAIAAETAASAVRVPLDIRRQRVQAGLPIAFDRTVLLKSFKTTLLRDIPFAAIQMACFEGLHGVNPYLAGSIAGFVAGAATTPLDVLRTRANLGLKGPVFLFSGVVPRTLWISLGGAIFLGVYTTLK